MDQFAVLAILEARQGRSAACTSQNGQGCEGRQDRRSSPMRRRHSLRRTRRHQPPYRKFHSATHTRSEPTVRCSGIYLNASLYDSGSEAGSCFGREANPQTASRGHGVGPKRRQHTAAIRSVNKYLRHRPDQSNPTARRTRHPVSRHDGAAVGRSQRARSSARSFRTSVRKQSRINRAGNRHLRRALYMPALVASRCDPHMRAFYESLLSRHKARLQVLVAVAGKLIHAIYGILRSQAPYDGCKNLPGTPSRKNRESHRPSKRLGGYCLPWQGCNK
jgi:Transposase IS116/IS110/IS902 family